MGGFRLGQGVPRRRWVSAPKRTRVGHVLCVCLIVICASAKAQQATFTVDNTTLPSGTGERVIDTLYPQLAPLHLGPALEAQLNPVIGNLAVQLKTRVESTLNGMNFLPFIAHSANAGAAALHAQPVDYATRFKIASLTAAGGAGFNNMAWSQLFSPSQLVQGVQDGVAPVAGLGAQISFTLGLNLAPFHLPKFFFVDPKRMQLFAMVSLLDVGSASNTFQISAAHYGGHFKYMLIGPTMLTNNFLVRWGGINLVSGLSFAKEHLSIRTALPTGNMNAPLSFENYTLNVNAAWSGQGTVGADMNFWQWPIELTTSLQLLYVLTFYGGVGVDFNWGHSKLTASAHDPVVVTAQDVGTGRRAALLTTTPSLDLSVTSGPTHVDIRGFAGLQINMGILAAFAQISADTTQTTGLAAGARAFW